MTNTSTKAKCKKIFSQENTSVLHNGSAAYSCTACSASALELSVCSSSLILDYEWSVYENLCGSDHFPIIRTSNATVRYEN